MGANISVRVGVWEGLVHTLRIQPLEHRLTRPSVGPRRPRTACPSSRPTAASWRRAASGAGPFVDPPTDVLYRMGQLAPRSAGDQRLAPRACGRLFCGVTALLVMLRRRAEPARSCIARVIRLQQRKGRPAWGGRALLAKPHLGAAAQVWGHRWGHYNRSRLAKISIHAPCSLTCCRLPPSNTLASG